MESTLFTELTLSEQASLAGGGLTYGGGFNFPTFPNFFVSNTNTNTNTAIANVQDSGNSNNDITVDGLEISLDDPVIIL